MVRNQFVPSCTNSYKRTRLRWLRSALRLATRRNSSLKRISAVLDAVCWRKCFTATSTLRWRSKAEYTSPNPPLPRKSRISNRSLVTAAGSRGGATSCSENGAATVGQQFAHFVDDRGIVFALPGEPRFGVGLLHFIDVLEQRVDTGPSVGGHFSEDGLGACNWPASQARAKLHSRFTVRSEMFNSSAISSFERPPK